jgi:hypothetical protein
MKTSDIYLTYTFLNILAFLLPSGFGLWKPGFRCGAAKGEKSVLDAFVFFALLGSLIFGFRAR